MKLNIALVSLVATIMFSCGQNKHVSWVYDYEGLLTPDQEKYLNSVISDFEKETTNEIMVVTSKDLDDYDDALQYAAEFGKIHLVGKEGEGNGLVLVVSRNLSKTALSTGYGPEKFLKNEVCEKIVDSCMIPQFSEERYFDGIKAGLKECIKEWK